MARAYATFANQGRLWIRAENNGQTLKVSHRTPDGSAADDVTVTGFDMTKPTVIEVHRAGLGLSVWDGSAYQSKVLTTDPFASPLTTYLGLRSDSDTFPMEGVIYETIVFAPGKTSNTDRAGVRAYLEAKWGIAP